MNGHTMESLIASVGGLLSMCALLGWQGGTIHQVEAEIVRRFHLVGIVRDKSGVFVQLKIGEHPNAR